jgi:glycine/D-amino acid oxidase-like deaminating enzyme
MDLRSGLPFQLVKSGLLYDYPKLMHDVKTDVVIIGGGISGALTAFYLAEAGIGCVVVDSRSIGLGSSCASTSLLQYEIDTPLHELIELVGNDHAVRSYKLCAESIVQLGDIAGKIGLDDFAFKNSLYYASSEKDVDKLYREFLAREKAGFNVTYLHQDEIRREFGFDAPSAILSKIGAQTDAYVMTHLLHQYSIKKRGKGF